MRVWDVGVARQRSRACRTAGDRAPAPVRRILDGCRPALAVAGRYDPDVASGRHPMTVPNLDAELIAIDRYGDLAGDWQRLELGADSSPFMAWPWVANWLKHLPEEIAPIVFRASDGASRSAT